MIINRFMCSTAIPFYRPIVFDPGQPPASPNGFPAALPGTVNVGMVQQLMNAAKIAGNDPNAASTTDDIGERSTDSAKMLPYWTLTDDIVTGYAAIKAKGATYLPKFPDELNDDYNNRLDCGKFTNIFRDIIETLAAKPFEEEVTLIEGDADEGETAPQPIKDFVENVDGAGNNMSSFAGTTFFNGINSAIDWIFVDYPTVDPTVIKTVADAKKANIKPFWSHVLGCNVLEATSAVVNGNEELIKMRILEPGTPNHVRVFEKNGDIVTWGLFKETTGTDNKKLWVLVGNGTISIGVIPLVPFYTGRRDGRTFFFYPVMRDAADLQIQLYRMESALNFAKIMTAYPMLAANGINPQMGPDGKTPKKLAVGPNKVLYSQRDGTSGNYGEWAYVSPDAACLTFLAADVKETQQQLRELGRLPLTAQSGNLTVITTAYAAGKSKSAVSAWGLRLKQALENALNMTAMWLGIDDSFKAQVNVYDEFDDFTDEGIDQTTLTSMRAARDLSRKTYWAEMKRRLVLSPEFDPDKEEQELLDETPSDGDTLDDDGAGGTPPKPGAKPPTKKPATTTPPAK